MVPYLITTAFDDETQADGAFMIPMPPQAWAKLNDWADTRIYFDRLYPAPEELAILAFKQSLTHVRPVDPTFVRESIATAIELTQLGIFEWDGTTPFLFERPEPEEDEELGWEEGITAGVLVSGPSHTYLNQRREQGFCAVSAIEVESPDGSSNDIFFRFEIRSGGLFYSNEIPLSMLTDIFGPPPPPRKFARWG